MDEEKKKLRKYCPFTPQIGNMYKVMRCIGPECMMWNGKKKDCGLKK